MQCWLPVFLCAFLCVCAHDAAHALPVVQNDRSMTGTVTFTGQGTPNLTSDLLPVQDDRGMTTVAGTLADLARTPSLISDHFLVFLTRQPSSGALYLSERVFQAPLGFSCRSGVDATLLSEPGADLTVFFEQRHPSGSHEAPSVMHDILLDAVRHRVLSLLVAFG